MRIRVFAIIWLAFCFSALLVSLLTGGEGEVFAAPAPIATGLRNQPGVGRKPPVRLEEIQIATAGHVHLRVRLDPQRAVFVRMRVKNRYRGTSRWIRPP